MGSDDATMSFPAAAQQRFVPGVVVVVSLLISLLLVTQP